MKFLIYDSEQYYPGADTYDTLPDAIAAFEKKKARRKEQLEMGIDPYFDTDYLCIVLDEIDKEKMKLEMAPFVPDDE